MNNYLFHLGSLLWKILFGFHFSNFHVNCDHAIAMNIQCLRGINFIVSTFQFDWLISI